jgi:hypothetical protein
MSPVGEERERAEGRGVRTYRRGKRGERREEKREEK